jgi:hypothetical protein
MPPNGVVGMSLVQPIQHIQSMRHRHIPGSVESNAMHAQFPTVSLNHLRWQHLSWLQIAAPGHYIHIHTQSAKGSGDATCTRSHSTQVRGKSLGNEEKMLQR